VAPVRQPEAWAGSDAAAAPLQEPDAPVQPLGAQAARHAALPAAQHVARRGQRLEVGVAPDAGPVARRAAVQLRAALLRAERAAVRRRVAAPLALPWARLPRQEGLPAPAGSAHRHSMHGMS
jgi:hypothetical protein